MFSHDFWLIHRFQLRTFLNLLPPSDTNRELFAIDQPLEVVLLGAFVISG